MIHDIIHPLVLGMVQGLGEFLPISSSAHLILVPWLFKWNDPGLGFDVALHWGTLLAVLIYFRNDIWLLAKGFWHSLFKSSRDLKNNIYQKLAWLLVIASVPGAIVGKLLEEKAETVFRENYLLIAMTLSIFGILVFILDKVGKKEKNLDRITWLDAVWVGLSQALAIIPGVSRSGSTMGMGLFLGFKRADAARFSFLMSVPIIFGAGILKIGDVFKGGASVQDVVLGFISATVFGFLSIKFLLKYLAAHDFKIFVWYRLLLAGAVVVIYYYR